MKNFHVKLLQDVKEFAHTHYEHSFDFVTLALANILNRNLRRLIVRQGKDPDRLPTPPEPNLKDTLSQEFHKRSPQSFHFIGTNAAWVKDKREHPTLKSRAREALTKFSAETAKALADASGELDKAEPNYLLNEPAFDTLPSLNPPMADSPEEIDLGLLLKDFKSIELPVLPKPAPVKKTPKFSKKRYSLKDGTRITYRGNK